MVYMLMKICNAGVIGLDSQISGYILAKKKLAVKHHYTWMICLCKSAGSMNRACAS
jgi:hypothetical protein